MFARYSSSSQRVFLVAPLMKRVAGRVWVCVGWVWVGSGIWKEGGEEMESLEGRERKVLEER